MIGDYSYSQSTDIDRVQCGRFCAISGRVFFHAGDNHAWVKHRKLVSIFPFAELWETDGYPMSGGEKQTVIGNDVWIGQSASILAGVIIGDGAIIGAHAVVAKDVPPYGIVVGNPGKVVKYRFSKKVRNALIRIKWWDWPKEKINQNMEFMKDVDKFVKKF